MSDAMVRRGEVLHTRASENFTDGEVNEVPYYTNEIWIDRAHRVARTEFRCSGCGEGSEIPARATQIVKGTSHFTRTDDEPPRKDEYDQHCPHDSDQMLAQLLGCGFNYHYDVFAAPTIEDDREFNGDEALVMIWQGVHDEHETYLIEVFVDPSTFLPMGKTNHFGENTVSPSLRRTTFEHEFVPRTSLPDDFFDASSLGID